MQGAGNSTPAPQRVLAWNAHAAFRVLITKAPSCKHMDDASWPRVFLAHVDRSTGSLLGFEGRSVASQAPSCRTKACAHSAHRAQASRTCSLRKCPRAASTRGPSPRPCQMHAEQTRAASVAGGGPASQVGRGLCDLATWAWDRCVHGSSPPHWTLVPGWVCICHLAVR